MKGSCCLLLVRMTDSKLRFKLASTEMTPRAGWMHRQRGFPGPSGSRYPRPDWMQGQRGFPGPSGSRHPRSWVQEPPSPWCFFLRWAGVPAGIKKWPHLHRHETPFLLTQMSQPPVLLPETRLPQQKVAHIPVHKPEGLRMANVFKSISLPWPLSELLFSSCCHRILNKSNLQKRWEFEVIVHWSEEGKAGLWGLVKTSKTQSQTLVTHFFQQEYTS